MTTSPEIDKLAAALAVAQGAVEGATKDAENSFFTKGERKAMYSTLASVWEACRAPLAANGLSVIQMPGDFLSDEHGARMTLTTRLCHSSGQWIEEVMVIPVAKVDAQGTVAAITYARRAALAAFVGVAPVDDDDGEAAVGRGKTGAAVTSAPAGGPSPATQKRIAQPPLSKIDNLRAQEKSLLEQLVKAQLADVLCLKDTPEAGFAKESLRLKMKVAKSDLTTVEGLEFWVSMLARYRDQNVPPPSLMA